MNVTIDDGRGRREVGADAFPLVLGGPDTALWLGADHPQAPVAVFGIEGSSLFIQPLQGAAGQLSVNGAALHESQWLIEGDTISSGGARIEIRVDSSGQQLVLSCGEGEPDTAPPLDAGASSAVSAEDQTPVADSRIRVAPVVFEPRRAGGPKRRSRRHLVWAGIVFLLVLLAAVAALVLSAQAVEIEITPEPDWVEFRGVWPTLSIGGRLLVIPGRYRLEAGRADHENLSTEVKVGRGFDGFVRAVLEPLPGRLTVLTSDLTGADVLVDGIHLGYSPLEETAVELGQHELEVLAARHQPFSTTFEIAEPAQVVIVEADLVEAWATLKLGSNPAGAAIHLDGRPQGTTPAVLEVGAGQRRLSFRLAGFTEHKQRVTIEPGKPVEITVTLRPAPGTLSVRTEPVGATITVDGVFKGVAPVDVTVSPAANHDVRAALAGHRAAATAVTVGAGQQRQLVLELVPEKGVVDLIGLPAGAEVLVDGQPTAVSGGSLELLAVPHTIEVRHGGLEPYRAEVTPRAGARTQLRVEVSAPPTPAPPAEVVTTSQEAELRLIRPGRFTMGAPRREPGRRTNEALRDVEITRPYYLGMREVTNRDYRKYNPDHRSGGFKGRNLEIDHHPVVLVKWDDAARYCNWLSAQEGLDPVYSEQGGRLVAGSPLANGYRLPTEAEWAWAARHPGGGPDRKYAWGDELPIPRGAGNFADAAAVGLVGEVIDDYSDGYAVTAPAGSFEGNRVGVFNLGGNVAEWTHDAYEVSVPVAGAVDRDPTGPAEGEYHVIRGASWMSDRVTELRLSAREAGKDRRSDVGFRIARFAQ